MDDMYVPNTTVMADTVGYGHEPDSHRSLSKKE